MKAGIAAAVVAAERLAAGDRPAGDVLVACVIDEEWASAGGRGAGRALPRRWRGAARAEPTSR